MLPLSYHANAAIILPRYFLLANVAITLPRYFLLADVYVFSIYCICFVIFANNIVLIVEHLCWGLLKTPVCTTTQVVRRGAVGAADGGDTLQGGGQLGHYIRRGQ